jgi:putative endonuclease
MRIPESVPARYALHSPWFPIVRGTIRERPCPRQPRVHAMTRPGEQAEQIAAQYLQRRGLKVLERNYRCRYGEIDLILRDGDTLVFAEVRLRRRADFGGAAASIDAAKQARLIHAAQHYLATQPRLPPCRFDAVLLSGLNDAEVEWIRNAFAT